LLASLLLVLVGLIPGMVVLNMRAGFSNLPRLHVFFDMDFQPKKKAQQTTTIFADGRTMRPQVKGTVARGQLEEQDPFYLGYDPNKLSAISDASEIRFVSVQPPDGVADKQAEDSKPADAAVAIDSNVAPPVQDPSAVTAPPTPPPAAAGVVLNLPWIDTLPIEATKENMELGKTKFETYCSACHGYGGYGDGLVHKRADALAQGYWTPPTSIHIDRVRAQPVGQIFHTITKGQNKMSSYASSITPKERWAIVLYVKALQRSRNADIKDVPQEFISQLKDNPPSK